MQLQDEEVDALRMSEKGLVSGRRSGCFRIETRDTSRTEIESQHRNVGGSGRLRNRVRMML